MIELVGALSDILRVEFREGEQDILVFDADVRPLPPGEYRGRVEKSSLVLLLVVIPSTKQITQEPWNDL